MKLSEDLLSISNGRRLAYKTSLVRIQNGVAAYAFSAPLGRDRKGAPQMSEEPILVLMESSLWWLCNGSNMVLEDARGVEL